MTKILRILTTLLFLMTLTVLLPTPAHAQPAGCTVSDPPQLRELACPIFVGLNWLIYLVGGAFVIMILYGSIKYSLSQGDSKALEGAKGTLTWAVIGFVIVTAVFSVLTIVTGWFGATPGLSIANPLQQMLNFFEANQFQ